MQRTDYRILHEGARLRRDRICPGQGVWIREDPPWDFAPGMNRGIWK